MTRQELLAAVNARLAQIEAALSPLSDEIALGLTTLFPVWAVGIAYTANERIQYGGKLYRCVQSHISQEGWKPPEVPALWTEVAKPGEIPVWRQPTGAQDAYQRGDKVWYPDVNTIVWISTENNNVWVPGVFGWVEEA